jgi:hypothetical protein
VAQELGLLECVFLNVCASEEVGARLRALGARWVVCWRGRVPDAAALAFACEFYECLNTAGRERDYRYAFESARMTCCLLGAPPLAWRCVPRTCPRGAARARPSAGGGAGRGGA